MELPCSDTMVMILNLLAQEKKVIINPVEIQLIKPGTLDDDLNRRDFTINALGISLNRKSWGDLLDKFNGITDLENKIT